MKKIYVTIMLFGCFGGNLHAAPPAAEADATNRIPSFELFRLIIERAHIDQIQDCLHRGADVNARNTKGDTPLHAAAEWRQGNLANVLLHRGANVNAQNFSGWTPLHTVLINYLGHMNEENIKNRARQTVQVLFDYDADPTIQDCLGCTPKAWVAVIDVEFQALMNVALRKHQQHAGASPQ